MSGWESFDAFSSGSNNNQNNEMSKFESFMERQQQKQQFGTFETAAEEEDDDVAMSRRRLAERQGQRGGGRQTTAPAARGGGSAAGGYPKSYNPDYGRPTSASTPSHRLTTPPRTNANNNPNTNYSNSNSNRPQQQRPTAGRTGRRLYADPNESAKNRSRSTVRRTADRTQRLANLAREKSLAREREGGGDGGSVISGFGDDNNYWPSSSGGGGSGGGNNGFPTQQQYYSSTNSNGGGGGYSTNSSGGQRHRSRSSNSSSSGRLLNRSLDSSYVATANSPSPGGYYDSKNDDNVSVASGTGSSVAARRRLKASAASGGGGGSTPSRSVSNPPMNRNQGGNGSGAGSGGGTPTRAIPSASASSAGSARRTMRMRMMQSSASASPSKTTSFSQSPSPSQTPTRGQTPTRSQQQSQQPRQNQPPQYRSPPKLFRDEVDESIDQEVNMAMNELKLDGIDFGSFRRVTGSSSAGGSSHHGSAATGSFDSSTVCSPNPSSSVGSLPNNNNIKGGGKVSPHTVSTKSMTVTTNNDNSTSAAAAAAQAATETVSPVISVEQHSESSSLTDDVGSSDFNRSGGGGGVNVRPNIFKDAERMGSTFHKSKKIIRPGESTPPTNKPLLPQSQEMVSATPSSSSVRDRISQFKNNNSTSPSSSVTTPRQSGAAKSRFKQQSNNKLGEILDNAQQTADETTEDKLFAAAPPSPTSGSNNSVKNSPFHQKDRASSSPSSPALTTTPVVPRGKNRLPPTTAPPPPASTSSTSPPDNASPFAVKLRKTTISNDESQSPTRSSWSKQPRDDVTEGSSSNNGDMEDDAVPKNPFLAQVKLRKMGGTVVAAPKASDSWQRKERADDDEEMTTDETAVEEAVVEERPRKKKLTYREQQELLRKQQQEEEEQQQRDESSEEPTKDVAALIRERIAANKKNSLARLPSASNSSNGGVGGGSANNDWRGNLKKTSVSAPNTPTIPPSSSPVVRRSGASEAPVESTKRHELVNSSKDEEEEESTDPRAALMTMLKSRTPPPSPTEKGAPKRHDDRDNGDQLQSSDPRNALSAMLNKRGASPVASPVAKASPVAASSVVGGGGDGSGRPALKNDPKYEKYFKMLKVGMPLQVVQHSMVADGLDPSVMEGDRNQPAPEPKPEGGVPLKDDPTYTKYFKMLKLGLPMGAVQNAMERDGLDPTVMDGDHNAPVISSTSAGTKSAKKRQKDTHRRTRLHWDTLGQVNSNSVWAMVEEDEELDQIEIDEKEFTTLFQAEIKEPSAAGGMIPGMGGGGGGGGAGGRNVVQVIDPKRANNGGIILARLRMSYDDMAKAVESIDETAMSANQAQGIIEYMPTLSERKALRDYMKASNESADAKFERLCECEKFMVAMMTVKQSRRKLKALLFKLQFRGCIHDLAHDVFSIEKACDELSNSVRLRKLFGIVLNIGNRLNTAGQTGQKRKAGAFTIKSLLKLNQAKAFDNKTTFLHYVVLVVQRNSEALLDFKDDLPSVSKADKIYWDQCVSELEEVETQLENVRKLALHEAKANKVVYQLPGKSKRGEEDNDSDDLSIESMSLEDEVALLRSTKVGMFALSAIRKVSQLRERVDTAKDKFVALLEYFGESGDTKMQPHELFEIITTFCRNFDVARADVEKLEKAKKRDEKKDRDDSKGSHRSEDNQTPVKKKPPLPRASSLQPNMSNVLSDMKRTFTDKSPPPGKVTPRYPDDESSRPPSRQPSFASIDERSEPQSSNAAPQQIRRQQPIPSQQNNSISEARLKARAAEEAKARDRAQAAEAARVAKEEEEKRLAYEAAAAREEAARIAMQEKQRLAQERRLAQKRQLAAEKAAAEEAAARIAIQHTQSANEAVASRSYESEVDGSTGSSEQKLSPSRKSNSLTRREIMSARRERARNRHFHQPTPSSTPNEMRNEAAPLTTVAKPAGASVEVTAVRAPPSNNANARASARDRYARHKKMLQNRHSST